MSTRGLRYRIKLLHQFLVSGFRLKKIVCYPDYPGKDTALFRICHHKGFYLTKNLKPDPDLVIYWQDQTFKDGVDVLTERYPNRKIINTKCRNIGKARVQKVFEAVFGYGLSLDPTEYTGQCLEKSELNAIRDCSIINCPIEQPRQGYVYQKLIDSIDDKGRFLDIRVPVFGQCIPHVYKHYRKPDGRFKREIAEWGWFHTEDVLGLDEVLNILQFCRQLGMDYGELDILRDNENRKIYIVDANDTPVGPATSKMSDEQRVLIMDRLSNAFSKEFLS